MWDVDIFDGRVQCRRMEDIGSPDNSVLQPGPRELLLEELIPIMSTVCYKVMRDHKVLTISGFPLQHGPYWWQVVALSTEENWWSIDVLAMTISSHHNICFTGQTKIASIQPSCINKTFCGESMEPLGIRQDDCEWEKKKNFCNANGLNGRRT